MQLKVFLSFILAFVWGTFVYPVNVAADTSSVAERKTIRVLILKNFPPQFVSTPDGPSGLAVEIIQDVARRMAMDIEFVTVNSWKEVYAPLKDGSIDVLSNMGISESRKKIAEFTDPYEVFDIKLFVRAETKDIQSLDDLGERVLGVQATNVLTKGLVESDKYNIKKFASFREVFLALLSGEVDAVPAPTEPFLLIARTAGLDSRVQFVGPSMLEIKRAMAVPKGNIALRDKLNAGLRALKQSDDYTAMLSKWYGAPTPYWTSAKIAILFSVVLTASFMLMIVWRYYSMLGLTKRTRLSEERFSLAMRGANDGLWDWNLKTDEVYYSPRWASMLGYESEQLEASISTWERLVDPRDKERVLVQTDAYLKGRTRTLDTEFRMNHKKGQTVYIRSRGFLVHDDGEPVRLVGTHVDITERKNNEEELIRHRDNLEELVATRTKDVEDKAKQLKMALQRAEAYNALQQKFVALVSHEFRTPLTIIDGAAQRLRRHKDALAPNEVIERTDEVRSAVSRMVGLIDTTLYASRLDEGKIDMQVTAFDIAALMTEVCNRQLEISPNFEFKLEIDKLPNTIFADPKLIDHVFSNLVSNAVKYSPDTPIIDVKGRQDGEAVIISVADRGVGMSKDDLMHMFERFFRAQTAKGIRGTGIGLSVSKEFVEMHGGHIHVESQEGKGSVFTVELPITRDTVDRVQLNA